MSAFYGELYHGQQTGHDAGTAIPGNLRDDLGRGERVWRSLRDRRRGQDRASRRPPADLSRQRSAGARQRLDQPAVAGVRRVPRLSRLGRSRGSTRSPTTSSISRTACCKDNDNAHTNLWGVYGSYDLPKFAARRDRGAKPRSICSISAGARPPFANGKGSAIYDDAAFLTGAKIVAATGAGFIASQDHRDTFGLRGYGESARSITTGRARGRPAAMPG